MDTNGQRTTVSVNAAIARVTDRIVRDRPAAVAGPPPFWAKLIGLDLALTTAALEALADRGVLRRQPFGQETFYIADPPHAMRPPQRSE
jgi:hypothetical protein